MDDFIEEVPDVVYNLVKQQEASKLQSHYQEFDGDLVLRWGKPGQESTVTEDHYFVPVRAYFTKQRALVGVDLHIEGLLRYYGGAFKER